MAEDLSKQLNSDIRMSNFQAYLDTSTILNKAKSQGLTRLANQLAEDYDGDIMALDPTTQAALLLHTLYSREEKNIDETALNFLDDSLDLNEFSGLFTNKTVKQILDLIVNHFVEAIRK